MEFSPVAVRGLLVAVPSLAAERGLWGVVFQWLPSCGSQALEHRLSVCGTLAYLFRGV